nr:hypothetical protein BaRGS_027690 [Batillaria attramentaria]
MGKQPQSLKLLLQFGASVNTTDKQGNTVYHQAVTSCPLVITVLKDYDKSGMINWPNAKGETPLFLACMKKLPEATEVLIHAGADPSITNTSTLPIHAAVSNGDMRELILYLLHVSGAKRCTSEVKGCVAGCSPEGSHNGVPDKAMSNLMRVDSVALLDELLSGAGIGKNATATKSSGAVLDMVDLPSNIGDRVLSLDGGGIRGLVLIQILMEIEAALGKPIRECFDWIGGTSTGGILALGIAMGFSLPYIKGLYVRMKDEVFKGTRPYNSQLFETMLKREFGENSHMSDIVSPK